MSEPSQLAQIPANPGLLKLELPRHDQRVPADLRAGLAEGFRAAGHALLGGPR
jgi:hypothetical protein